MVDEVKQEIKSTPDPQQPKKPGKNTNTTLVSVMVLVMFIFVILATGEISKLTGFEFIAQHLKTLESLEFAVFTILLVESVGRAIVAGFKRRGNEPVGHSVRAVLRGVVYFALAIGIVSSLSSNPGLAIGIGTVTGIVIAFSTQNLVGNMFAGVLLAIVRPVKIGDQVTILGSSGTVQEIALIYTILEDGANLYFVPSMTMFSNVVIRKKGSLDKIQKQ
jgi:small-conductance mechanosensitive channel